MFQRIAGYLAAEGAKLSADQCQVRIYKLCQTRNFGNIGGMFGGGRESTSQPVDAFEGHNVVSRTPPSGRMWAARVIANHARDRRAILAGRIRTET